MNKMKLLLLLRTILFIIFFLIIALITNKGLKDISKYWTLIVILCNLITIFTLYCICKKNNIKYLELIGYKKTKLKKIVIIGLLIILIAILGTYLSGFIVYNIIPYNPDIIFQTLPIGIAFIDLLLLPITSIIAEEGIYLGFGINKLKELSLTIFFYLLQHCFFSMIWDFKYMIYRFIAFVPVVIFMCVYYKKKEK